MSLVCFILLYAYIRFDVRVRVVVCQLEVLVAETEDILYVGVDNHAWQRARSACQLQLCLLQMVKIEVCVAGGVNEVTALEACYLCHHLQQQSV